MNFLILGEEQGRLEPCNCTTGMLGGIARRRTAIEEAYLKHPDLIILHNGNLINQFGVQQQLKRNIQIQDLNQLKISTMGVGTDDFILGKKSLLRFKQKVSFPLLASNLIDQKKRFSFQKEWSKKAGNTKVRVFSLYALSEQSKFNQFADTLRIQPIDIYIEALSKTKKENEFWIFLFHGQPYEAYQLAGYSDLVNMIVYNQQGEDPFFQQIGNVNLVSTGNKGRSFVTIDFSATPPFQFLDLSKYILNTAYEDHPTTKKLLEQYKINLKKEGLAEKYPKVAWPTQATYVGNHECIECHHQQYDVWKQTKHVYALDNLMKENHHFDPECLQCHSTGFQFEGGFTSLQKTEDLAKVGCESCHGPQSLHIQDPESSHTKKPTKTTCIQCHDPENSPSFNFKTYWRKIKH